VVKISIEKRPMNGEESYFVLSSGEKQFAVTVNAIKAMALIWVFLMTAIFTFVIGMQTAQQGVMMTAYLTKGNLSNEKGEPVNCQPTLTAKRAVSWNCTIGNVSVGDNLAG
jgi:hypothetical protein